MSTSERIQEVKARLAVLRAEELELESELVKLTEAGQKEASQAEKKKEHLVPDDIRRYSRQLLIPEIGVHGQLQLQNAKVLIVGTGGLGSPCAMYLASMGIGTLGLIDHDVVDSSNLHRQIIHTEAARNVPKVVSAHNSLSRLNSSCKVSVYDILLDSANALDIMRGYDVVVDATDNAATRYLINDACVMLTIPLVSGSAVRLDGQLTVYNYNGGPCYRCLFPTPPPVETLSNCSETGVLGVVPGIIGCLQAMEAVKVITGKKLEEKPNMLLYSYTSQPHFRSIKLRSRKPTCAVCGDAPSITELVDYVAFCGSGPNDAAADLHILQDPSQRVSCRQYNDAVHSGQPHVLLDVREKVQFDICQLPNSLNIPLADFDRRQQELAELVEAAGGKPIYTVCRRGNDSQYAVQYIRNKLDYKECYDIVRGLLGWQADVDPEFPAY